MWAGVVLFAATSCRDSRDAAPLPVRAEFGGCDAVEAGPLCLVTERTTLTIWLDVSPTADVRVEIDGRTQSAAARPTATGLAREVEVDSSARRLSFTVSHGSRLGRWSLELDRRAPNADVEAARALRASGAIQPALDHIQSAMATCRGAVCGPLLGMAARLHFDLGHHAEGRAALEEAIRRNREHGRHSAAVEDLQIAAFRALQWDLEFGVARSRVAESVELATDDHHGMAQAAYFLGLLAQKTGQLRDAIRHFAAAADRADHIGYTRLVRSAMVQRAEVLQQLGRYRDAVAALDTLAARPDAAEDDCVKARRANTDAWLRFLDALERDGGEGWMSVSGSSHRPAASVVEATARMDRVVATYRATCPVGSDIAVAATNLALGHLAAGEFARARGALAEARAATGEDLPYLVVWWDEVEGRAAIGEGRLDVARAAFERMRARGAIAGAPAMQWRAAVGAGDVAWATGDWPAAAAAYARAESTLDDQLLAVPVADGRDTFLGDRDRSARRLADALVHTSRPSDALTAARHARRRYLATLQRAARVAEIGAADHERWDAAMQSFAHARASLAALAIDTDLLPTDERDAHLALRAEAEAELRRAVDGVAALTGVAPRADALPPLDPDAVTLVFHRGVDGWLTFAADPTDVTVARVPTGAADEPADALAARLLAPHRARIEAATRLVILPSDRVRAVDFHRLPWGDGPLVAALPVSYAVDLTRSAPAAPVGTAPVGTALVGTALVGTALVGTALVGTALVVGDPRGDLPAARQSANDVGARLGASGAWRVSTLTGDAARADAVRAALAKHSLFHYAGHGEFGGALGWESALLLAGGTRLTIGDVLGLETAPTTVVLSACETARTADTSPLASIGIAQAFAVAGASVIIAAVRPVDDAFARAFTAALYRLGLAAPGADVPAVVRAAQLELRKSRPSADWASFRAIVR